MNTPFDVTTIAQLMYERNALKGKMTVERVAMPEWLTNILADQEPWQFAPETNLSQVMAQLYEVAGGFDAEAYQEVGFDSNRAMQLLEKFVAEARKAIVRIGRADDGYFDMDLVRISKDGKSHTIGMIEEEPSYEPAYKAKHPIGMTVLPYYIVDGNIYLNVAVRNEQGAVDAGPVVVAGEQTGLTKLLTGGVIDQPGGSVLAACIQDFGTVDCEDIPNLENIKARTKWFTYWDNTNRVGGGFKQGAIVEVTDEDADLVEKYKTGMWVGLDELMEIIMNTNEPIINTFLASSLLILSNL
ncbi:hypothetical protein ISR94_03425 [Candidatus Microgenomates bacterium]|nr:hypothetical protein [Candidatus Microgenomates bacterium]